MTEPSTKSRLRKVEEAVLLLDRDLDRLSQRLSPISAKVDSRASQPDLGILTNRVAELERKHAHLDRWGSEMDGRVERRVIQWNDFMVAINEQVETLERLQGVNKETFVSILTRLTAITAWQEGIDEYVGGADERYVLAADHDLLHQRVIDLEDDLGGLRGQLHAGIGVLDDRKPLGPRVDHAQDVQTMMETAMVEQGRRIDQLERLLLIQNETIHALAKPIEPWTVPADYPEIEENSNHWSSWVCGTPGPEEPATAETQSTMDRYEQALTLLAGVGCTRIFTRPGQTELRCCDVGGDWSAFATYGADKWCDPCIAHAALNGIELR